MRAIFLILRPRHCYESDFKLTSESLKVKYPLSKPAMTRKENIKGLKKSLRLDPERQGRFDALFEGCFA